MARLHQINLQFDPLQDRALLRLNTEEQAEFRFWLTRRFVKLLWPVLIRSLEANPEVERQSSPVGQQTVLSFQREQALGSSDFQTEYHGDAQTFPAGETPRLVYKAELKPGPGKERTLGLYPKDGQGVQLALTEALLHSFCKLLAETVAKAAWDLPAVGAKTSPPIRPDSARLN